MNRCFGILNGPAEGTKHLLGMKGSHLLQGINDRIDIFILSHVFHPFANEEVSRKKPSLIRLKKTDMVIGMSWGRNHHKVKFLGLDL